MAESIFASSSRAFSVLCSVGLLIICLICYILYIVLYISPQSLHLDSLLYPDTGLIKPAVAVGLITALFLGATSAFITRSVEHGLWLELSTSNDGKQLTVGESRKLALWSVSPLYRLFYVLNGRSWLLKFGGLFLFASVALNPVLLSGISQATMRDFRTEWRAHQANMFAGRLDTGNRRYRGGNNADNPTLLAALAAMKNFTAPAAPVCTNRFCSVSARVLSIRAECKSARMDNPDGIGLTGASTPRSRRFCSTTNPKMCVLLVRSSPSTYANFTSSYPSSCQDGNSVGGTCPCTAGDWSTIFGAWVNGADLNSGGGPTVNRLNTVDCAITFGNVTVRQNGTSPPTLDRATYTPSSLRMCDINDLYIRSFWRIYTELGGSNTPYSWNAGAVGTGANSGYSNPMVYALLGEDAVNAADTVARQIEANFDMATLHAFARQPNATDLTLEFAAERQAYVYNARVLAILVVPFLATFLAALSNWRVADDRTVVGYDPVAIARLGPVEGLVEGVVVSDRETRQMESGLRVWMYDESRPNLDGSSVGRMRFITDGETGHSSAVSYAK